MKGNFKSIYLYLLILALLSAIFLFQKGSFTNRGQSTQPVDSSQLSRDPSRLVYSRHARCRMRCRQIDDSEVKEMLLEGSINSAKSEPNGRPDPKFAVEGRTHDGQRVRIIFAASRARTVVVTVIDLDQDISCNCP